VTTDLPVDIDEVRSLATSIFQEGLIEATIRGHRPQATTSLKRVRARPVSIGDTGVIQFEEFDGTNTHVINLSSEAATEHIVHLFGSGMKTAFIRTTTGDLQVTISRRGKVQQVRHATSRDLSSTQHDRQKQHLIAESAPFLRHVGISTENGTVRPNTRDKFRQVQQFVGILDRLVAEHDRAAPLRIVDLGCGSGVLTLAAHHHLMASGVNVHTTGVDLKSELMTRLNNTIEQLGWSTIDFVTGAISQWQPKPGAEPDLVIALHACDTATDDAIAQAIAWRSTHLLVAPCCQHDLQRQIDRLHVPRGFESLVRHGIVRERLGDLLTDTFRADVLAALGWRTDVIEFVDNQHTAKNVMIRASQTGELDESARTRALQLAAEWSVQPALIHLLADRSTM
jgi:SAM-dependent methyltransferase